MKKSVIGLLLLITTTIFSQEYIQIIRPDINIRMKSTTESPIVGHAFEGEIYITNGEEPKWYSVLLPSGESRWIYKKLTKKTQLTNFISDHISIREIQEELKIASDKANLDANEEIIKGLNKVEINKHIFHRGPGCVFCQ